jgi:hypothetical protein
LAIRGDQWPLLLYENEKYDPEDPWNGLLRNRLLVWVGDRSYPFSCQCIVHLIFSGIQTYIYLSKLRRERG